MHSFLATRNVCVQFSEEELTLKAAAREFWQHRNFCAIFSEEELILTNQNDGPNAEGALENTTGCARIDENFFGLPSIE